MNDIPIPSLAPSAADTSDMLLAVAALLEANGAQLPRPWTYMSSGLLKLLAAALRNDNTADFHADAELAMRCMHGGMIACSLLRDASAMPERFRYGQAQFAHKSAWLALVMGWPFPSAPQYQPPREISNLSPRRIAPTTSAPSARDIEALLAQPASMDIASINTYLQTIPAGIWIQGISA